MDYVYWWQSHKETGLEETQSEFLNNFINADFIPAIYNPILYNYYYQNNLKHWDSESMEVGYNKIQLLRETIGNSDFKSVLLKNMNLLIDSLEGVENISKRMELMENFRGSMELKASLFLINIYNDLLNGSYSKILQLYIKFESNIAGKNLDQKTLSPQMECLSSRNYEEILNVADANIRNAISHDGVKITHNEITFKYRKGRETLIDKYSIYEIKDKVITLFDSINGLLISFIRYLIENEITFDDVYDNDEVDNDVINFYEKLSMSTLNIDCKSIEEIKISRENITQLNVTLRHNNLDIQSRYMFGIHTAARAYVFRNLTTSDRVFINFEADKTMTSFIRISGTVIQDFVNGDIDEAGVVKAIQKSGDYMLFPTNDEPRNKYEDLFRYYADIDHENFTIKEIEDTSNYKEKRFRAVVYVNKVLNRRHIEQIVFDAVNEMINLKNYGFTDHKVKHGVMKADIIYLVVYKKELRGSKHKNLMPSNKNFLVQIQFDESREFNIKNQIIDKHLLKKRKGKIEFNWNPNFYKFS